MSRLYKRLDDSMPGQGNLTDKQRAFVQEYLLDLNATQAAIRAGYSKKTAYATGAENLRKPQIAHEIEEGKAKRAERTRVDQDKVVKELAKLGLSDMRELAQWDEYGVHWRYSGNLTDEAAACVKDVSFTREVRYDKNGDRIETTQMKLALHDKKAALKMLGDHLGIFGGTDEHPDGSDFLRGAEARRKLYEEKHAEAKLERGS